MRSSPLSSLSTSRRLPHVFVLALGALCASAAFAYDWEATVGVQETEVASAPAFSGSLRYYFSPLTHSSASPWAETDFTERLPYLQGEFDYQRQRRTVSTWPEPVDGAEPIRLKSTSRAVRGIYVGRSAASPHSFGASVGYREIKAEEVSFSNPWPIYAPDDGLNLPQPEITYSNSSVHIYNFSARYDYYLQDAWTLGLRGDYLKIDPIDSDSRSLSLQSNRLWKTGASQWAGLKAAVTRGETDFSGRTQTGWIYSLEGRYYFSPRTGLSLGLEIPDGGFEDRYTLGLSHFFTDRLFAAVEIDHIVIDLPTQFQGDDALTNYGLKLGLRF